MEFFRIPFAIYLNLGLSAIAGFGCLIIAAIWMIKHDSDWMLLAIFGVWNTYVCVQMYRQFKTARGATRMTWNDD
jgi:hypothetical protein